MAGEDPTDPVETDPTDPPVDPPTDPPVEPAPVVTLDQVLDAVNIAIADEADRKMKFESATGNKATYDRSHADAQAAHDKATASADNARALLDAYLTNADATP